MSRAIEIANRFFQLQPNDTGQLELKLGTFRISELAERFGTPFFVYDQSVMQSRLRDLRATFGPEFSIYYSIKANPDPRVVRFFASEGDGLEIASAGELKRAIDSGCSPSRILFAGPGKTVEEITQAVHVGISEIHVESLTEIERVDQIAGRSGKTMPVCIRINPSGESQGGTMRMGGLAAPFGIDEEQLESVIEEVQRRPNLTLHGIHLFAGTQILDAEILLSQYQRFVDLAEQVADQIAGPLGSIDFGGGLGVPYFRNEQELELARIQKDLPGLVNRIRDNAKLRGTRLMVEPGRFLTAESGIYVSKINDIKVSRETKFAVIDGGMHHHLAASGNLGQVIKRDYPIACLNKMEETGQDLEKVDIVGPLCTPLDKLGRNTELPVLDMGDLIGVFCSGAYGRSASPLGFLSHACPAELFLNENRVDCLRVRFSEQEDAPG